MIIDQSSQRIIMTIGQAEQLFAEKPEALSLMKHTKDDVEPKVYFSFDDFINHDGISLIKQQQIRPLVLIDECNLSKIKRRSLNRGIKLFGITLAAVVITGFMFHKNKQLTQENRILREIIQFRKNIEGVGQPVPFYPSPGMLKNDSTRTSINL